MKRSILLVALWVLLPTIQVLAAEDSGEAALRAEIRTFVEAHCLDCHAGNDAEAGLDLESLPTQLSEAPVFEKWVKVHDKLQAGEMPPPDYEQPADAERKATLASLAATLRDVNAVKQAKHGRVQFRRLNRVEYENTLRDLLMLPNLEVSGMLPPDDAAHGFDNVGSALALSYVQMARYLDAADEAVTTAIVLRDKPSVTKTRLDAKTNGRFAQVLKKGQEAVPIGDAVGLLRQPNTAQAPWWWSNFEPPMDGYYRVRMKSFGFIWEQGKVMPADETHAVTFHAVQGTTKRPLGTFDIGRSADDASVHDFQAFLRQGDQIQIWFETLDDRNKQRRELAEYTAPGVAIEWLDVEGPLLEQWPPASYQALFGDLPLEVWTPESGRKEPPVPVITTGVGKRATREPAKRNEISLYHVVSQQPQEDARRLLVDFASRAFRRPVKESELDDIFALMQQKLDDKYTFQESMRVGCQAILCAPEFLFLHEQPGRLDQFALASRLSYFLWGSLPDKQLRELVEEGELNRPEVLRKQVERMLDDPKSLRFVENFCGQWLDLRRITITQPDEQLYPEFDQLLLNSMVEETHAYFAKMIEENLGIDHIVDSDFAMLNARLAELYNVANVEGVKVRKVPLSTESPRGGLLTQASLLKVTANGTTTSPVTRGAWVLDRIYGQPSPLPPPNVPAVEPDLRGTTTIREQLDKHRSDAACASCHRKIDPPGFALESFDVIGGWRDRYRSLGEGDNAKKTFKNNQPVQYKLGPSVDPSGTAPGGKAFEDIHSFRKVLLNEKEQLARNMTRRLLVYGTGAGIQFADRQIVDEILDRTRDEEFGLRSLIHEVVQSKTFQSK